MCVAVAWWSVWSVGTPPNPQTLGQIDLAREITMYRGTCTEGPLNSYITGIDSLDGCCQCLTVALILSITK